ncbi:MAG: sugar phosphate nucleotidyltransferase [Candidatus Berkelbacteria bacterium]
MIAVILASGQGSRLWPLSRQSKPKQFHSLLGENTLLQDTYLRLTKKLEPKDIFVVTAENYAETTKEQLPDLEDSNLITEPFATGTLGSIGIALPYLNKLRPDEKVIFVPSDHIIYDTKAYTEILDYAETVLDQYPDKMLTLGINPTCPDTGMGYIMMDNELSKNGELRAFSAQGFVEKPDAETAQKYLASWKYLWNSGMFMGNLSRFIEIYRQFAPETAKILDQIGENISTPKEAEIKKNVYDNIEKTSFDYAIMEKLDDYIVIPGDFGWSDVGSWGTLLQVLKNHYHSSVISKGNHVGVDDNNCLVLGQDKMIATVGLKDVVIIETKDSILVCNANESQKIKELIDKFGKEGKHLYL